MSDTLQLVVDSTDAQLHYDESINSCVFLLRWGFGSTTTSWSVSDIRWVIPIWLSGDEDDDKLKRIGHSLSHSDLVEWWWRRRQAEAYRTFVERFQRWSEFRDSEFKKYWRQAEEAIGHSFSYPDI